MSQVPNAQAVTTPAVPATQVAGGGAQIPPNATVAANPPTPATTPATVGQPAVSGTIANSTSQTPAETSQSVSVDPRQQINELSQQSGLDLSQFSDYAQAQAAVKLYAESIARQGMAAMQNPNGQQVPFNYGGIASPPAAPVVGYPQFAEPAAAFQSPPVHPVQQATTQYVPVDLKALGVDDDEPAAKAIRALEKNLQAVQQEVLSTKTEFQGFTAAQRAAQTARLESEADSIVDSFKSPTYGVGQNRSIAQQMEVQKLRNVVNAITTQDFYASQGQYVRPLAERFALAKIVLEQQNQAAAVQQAVAAAPAAAQTPPAPQSTSGQLPSEAKLSVFGAPWSQNPQIRALVGAN